MIQMQEWWNLALLKPLVLWKYPAAPTCGFTNSFTSHSERFNLLSGNNIWHGRRRHENPASTELITNFQGPNMLIEFLHFFSQWTISFPSLKDIYHLHWPHYEWICWFNELQWQLPADHWELSSQCFHLLHRHLRFPKDVKLWRSLSVRGRV